MTVVHERVAHCGDVVVLLRRLDVSLLQENLLAPVLGIGDPRRDKRVDFVGGIRVIWGAGLFI